MPPPSRLPRKKPSQNRSAITVAAILEAAVHIFEVEGYRAATTVKVAENAGVSIGSLYQYFPNKLALLAGVKQRYLADLFAQLEAALSAAKDCETGIRTAVRVNLRTSHAARRLWQIFAEELPARIDLRAGQPTDAPHVTLLRHFFQRQRAELTGRDPGLAALVVAEMVDAVTRAALQDRPDDLVNGTLEAELLDALLLYLQGKLPAR